MTATDLRLRLGPLVQSMMFAQTAIGRAFLAECVAVEAELALRERRAMSGESIPELTATATKGSEK